MTNRVTNDTVATKWAEGSAAMNHKGTLHTDGKKIYSYNLQIGDTCEETGKKVLRDHTARGAWQYYSQTTSCHVGLCRKHADIVA